MDKELGDCTAAQKLLQTDVDLIEDRMMDVEMSAQGAHRMIAEMKEEVRDFSDSFGNLHNQVETMRVEDIAWCRSRISVLEKPNNPANKSLWTLVNLLIRVIAAFFFQPFQPNSPHSLHSTFPFPLTNHTRRLRSNNELVMIVSFKNDPTTTINTGLDYSMGSSLASI
jgi:hypothetical protein